MNKLIACIVLIAAVCFSACDKQIGTMHVAVTNIVLDTEAFALKIGATRTLAATVAPEDATDRSVVWASDDDAIASVDPMSGVVTGRGIGKTKIRVTPARDRSPEASCTVTVLDREPYMVGDLYPDAVTPQGMVFWIDPADPAKGKIVSLDQTLKSWGGFRVATSAQDSNDGWLNMLVIQTLEDWQSDYPAFAWCAAKGMGWYLPARNELLTLYEAKEILDEVIERNGDIAFTGGDYWSSTEQQLWPELNAVTVLFRYASDNESWASKNGQCAVRAIKVF